MWYIHSLRFDRDVRVILQRNFLSMVTDINTPYLESWRYYQSLFSRWDQCVVLDPHRSPLWIQCEDRCDLVLVAQEHSEWRSLRSQNGSSCFIYIRETHNYHYFTKPPHFKKGPPFCFMVSNVFKTGGLFKKRGAFFKTAKKVKGNLEMSLNSSSAD